MQKEGLSTFATPRNEHIREKVNRLLLDVNKPSRYIGQEIGSVEKSWDDAEARMVIAFPDMYEIGVSNLGHRILYYIVNNYKQSNFLADRAYAPDVDYRDKLKENNIPLYGVENFMPLSAYDVVAFSLQYELSYPTILSMLDMGGIPIHSSERNESDPIVVAGGPGSYNPEPIADFIDAFLIGDGEEVVTEILETIKFAKLQNLSRKDTLLKLASIDGVYVPIFYASNGFSAPVTIESSVPNKVSKRISQLKSEDVPIDFPVSYSQIVHDRAVVEIRRGCGRMCRFCQSCFVNLPVRERSPEEIVDLAGKLIKNTGYDEYSLLSLSSNDYKNITELVCALNNNHSESGASISLPSQRADAFSLDLANQVQSVRKSTITFAPEAGSQRLRDAINKNLEEEHILNAVESVYSAGWSSVKLYFMLGLPTETYEDLDAMIALLSKIKTMANKMRAEKGLSKPLEITCTVSIFVPKPFTPFQWFGQDSLKSIEEKVAYLREKVKSVKGVRLNFHEGFLSLLEAVFARGDRKLNSLIEAAYKKGSYLDAWNEHFNKQLWFDAASETEINFAEYAEAVYSTEDSFPWDFINVGVNREWLVNQYNSAVNSLNTVPCDTGCSNCGVCSNFGVSKVLKSIEHVPASVSSSFQKNSQSVFRYRLTLQKTGKLRFISHLDWNRLLYKAFRKAGIKLAFTQGFNPSPKISVALALPIFIESKCEPVEVELLENLSAEELMAKLNKVLPQESAILNCRLVARNLPSADQDVKWAEYTAILTDKDAVSFETLNESITNLLAQEQIIVRKVKGRKVQEKDIRPFIKSVDAEKTEDRLMLRFVLMTGQCGNLRADEFVNMLTPGNKWNIAREILSDKDLKELV